MISYVKLHSLSSGIYLNNFINGIMYEYQKRLRTKVKILDVSLGILKAEEAPVKTSISHVQLCDLT